MLSRKMSIFFTMCLLLLMAACNGTSKSYQLATSAESAGNLQRAYQAYRTSLTELKRGTPEYDAANRGLQRVAGQLAERDLNQADAALGGSLESANISQVERSLSVLRGSQYASLDQRIGARQDTLQSALAEKRGFRDEQIALAEQQAALGDIASLKETAATIRSVDPSYDSTTLLETATEAFFDNAIASAEDVNTSEGVVALASRVDGISEAFAQHPRLPRLRRAVADAVTRVGEQVMSESVSGNTYYVGLGALNALPGLDENSTLMQQYQRMAQNYYVEQARLWEANGNFSRAFVELYKARRIAGDVPELIDQMLPLRDQVERALERSVAIYQFGSPSTDKDIGGQVASELLTNLSRRLGYGYRVIDRSEELFDRTQETEGASGGVLSADYQIAGTISELVITESKNEYSDSVRVKVGETKKESQAYLKWYERKLEDPRFNAPPPERYIIEPIYENRSYRRGTATINGSSRTSARIIERETTEVLVSENFTANFEEQDEFRDPVREANIKLDPVDLPNKITARRIMAEKIVEEVSKMALKNFHRREMRIFSNIERLIGRREFAAAYNQIAQGIVFCNRVEQPESKKACERMDDLVNEYTEGNFWSFGTSR